MPFLSFPRRGLYAVTCDQPDLTRLLIQVESALKGGARVIQLRDKHRRYGPAEARRLLELCHAHQVPLIVNDDVDLAQHIGADGVHLGRTDPEPARVRARLGPDAIIGVSCYADLERAIAAQRAGASYVALGAFFPSATKPDAGFAPASLLALAKASLSCPVVAIGGITPANGAGLIRAGADLLAVIHGVFGQPDPALAARRYAKLFEAQDEQA